MNRLFSLSFTKVTSLLLILSMCQQLAKAEDPNGSASVAGVYVVTNDESIRTGILQRRQAALDQEAATEIDSLRAIQK